ncbi:BQ2448_7254 [Microbotryum intermedium]|uniref:BQ2448_7254 protein n=1 Tax=Microbotryum intermedium TaxID=269621 RepID=A0A238FQ50_9BASI|nr:BQ2448_7254 [Microbotryum intermedium]
MNIHEAASLTSSTAVAHPHCSSAFHSGAPACRHTDDRESSTDSWSSEELISYGDTAEEDSPFAGNIVHGVRTTRQLVDRRPLSDWDITWAERLCKLAAAPEQVHELVPETVDRGPMPTIPWWNDNAFILARALITTVLFYVFNFIEFARMVLDPLNRYSIRMGLLDEKKCGRDRTPNVLVNNLAFGVVAYMFIRPLFAFLLAYDKTQQPLDIIRWSYPLRLMGWQLTLDCLFYCYHRLTHEIDSLWWVHKHHHSTKHPTSILPRTTKEVLEIFILPFLSSLLWRQTFTEQWITLCYTLMVEMQGHSGIRAVMNHSSFFCLKVFDCDHDLHHRMGKSEVQVLFPAQFHVFKMNFSKQSTLYDKIYGTRGERLECYEM